MHRDEHPQLSDQAATYVRELIMSSQLLPGDYIRQERLADDLGMSATPVREGLLALRGEGFVRLEPRRGFVVAPLTGDDIRDLFAGQALIAGELAARAAQAVDADDLRTLQQLQTELDRMSRKRDYERMERLNHEFHRHINLRAASPKLAWMLGVGARYVPSRFYSEIRGWPDASLHDHRTIIEAITSHSAEQARQAMHDHFVHAGDLLARHRDHRATGQQQPTRRTRRSGGANGSQPRT